MSLDLWSSQDLSARTSLERARESLLRRILLMTTLLVATGAQLIFYHPEGKAGYFLLGLALLAGVLGILPTRYRQTRLLLLLASVIYPVFMAIPEYAYSGGGATILGMLGFYVALLLGTRAGFWATMLSASLLLVEAILHLTGAVHLLPGQLSLGDPILWLRSGTSIIVLILIPLGPVMLFLRELDLIARARAQSLDLTIAEEMLEDDALRLRRVAQDEQQTKQRELILGRLAGGLAHEINSVLQEIEGMIELLRLEPRTAATEREAIQEIRESAKRAAAVGRRLLYVGGQSLPHCLPTDLGRYLEKAQTTLRTAAGPGIQVHWQVERCPLALVDTTELTHVLINLVVNARDAMKMRGELYLRLRAPEQLSGAKFLRLEVEDRGPGIPDSLLPRIFEPFFTTKGRRGTGLGLPTVKRLIESGGGRVEVESQVGQGTLFRLLLPSFEQDPEEVFAESGRAITSSLAQRTTETRLPKVLFVEDQAAIREVFGKLLPRHGVEVWLADSVDSALARLEQERPHLIWSDAIMPGRPTQELIEKARELGLPLVICSGHVQNELLRTDLLRFGVEFIPKPYSLGQLLDRARQALAESEQAEPPRTPLVTTPPEHLSLPPTTADGPVHTLPCPLNASSEPEEAAVQSSLELISLAQASVPAEVSDRPVFTQRSEVQSAPMEAKRAEYGAPVREVAELSFSAGGSSSGPPLKLLVVDDDAQVRRALTRSLERQGYVVESARDGFEAEELYFQTRPDLVLMDAQMPGKSGQETASDLLLRDPEAKVILCSGNQELERQAPLGVLAVLIKPLDMAKLRALTDELELRPRC